MGLSYLCPGRDAVMDKHTCQSVSLHHVIMCLKEKIGLSLANGT